MQIVYRSNLVDGLVGWHTVRADRPGQSFPLDGGRSYGPWWLDPNHGGVGAGDLHLLAYAYGTSYSDPGAGQVGVLPQIDMMNAKVRVEVSTTGLTMDRDAMIGLWLQAYDPLADGGRGAMINIMNVTTLLCDEMSGAGRPSFRNVNPLMIARSAPVEASITLTDEPREWLSLGSSVARERLYGHVDKTAPRAVIRACLRNWVDWGFIMLLPPPKERVLALGEIRFHSVIVEQ